MSALRPKKGVERRIQVKAQLPPRRSPQPSLGIGKVTLGGDDISFERNRTSLDCFMQLAHVRARQVVERDRRRANIVQCWRLTRQQVVANQSSGRQVSNGSKSASTRPRIRKQP